MKNSKVSLTLMAIIFFLMMFLMNGLLFPWMDGDEITTQILLKTAGIALIGTLVFAGIMYLIRKNNLD